MSPQARQLLDTGLENELILDILSYSGGENTVSEDHIAESNEARIVKNWDALSLGGMTRTKGFNRVASGATAAGALGATASSLGHFHYKDSDGTSHLLAAFGTKLYRKSSANLILVTGGVFTSGELHHATDGSDDAWITSLTDNLRRYTITGGLVTPASQPTAARERIYRHKNRLIAEGGGAVVYGSRAGVGNWTAANAWSLANDAWNITLPNVTKGAVPNFPSGDEILVFTEFGAYALHSFPNVGFRPLSIIRGCSAPYSIALGDEGVYFLSRFPTLGVYLYDGVKFTELTAPNKDAFVDKINFSGRIHGIYRDRKYHIFYNEKNSGVSYQNRWRTFDAKFGRWMEREVNSGVSDNFGIPLLLTKQSNELYSFSSRKTKLYELETEDNSDEGQNTEADYKTKNFTSRDFGSKIDDLLMKLLKVTTTYYGTTGTITLQWTADEGKYSGSMTFDLSAGGDLINTTLTVNSSNIVSTDSIANRVVTKYFSNGAIGRRFNFQVLNNGTSTRPKVKKIKIYAEALSDL